MSSSITERLRTLIESTPPFNSLPEEAREDVLRDVTIEYYSPGEVVIEQGSTVHKGLYIVESGTVRLMDLDNQRLLDKCSEGDLFGAFGLMKGGASLWEAKAIEPTVCAILKSERFHHLYDEYEDFATYFENEVRHYVRHIDKEMDVTGSHLLFNRRLNQFVHRGAVVCAPDATAQQAARLMRRERVDSVIVMQDGRISGIMTDVDLRNKLIARGQPLETPVRRLMASPAVTVRADASLFEAMMVMLNQSVNRLVIVSEDPVGNARPVGILTDRDMAHFRGQDPVATVQRIENAPTVSELVTIRAATNEQMLRLYRQGVQPEMINAIVSVVYDSLAVRVVELAEKELRSRYSELRVDLPWAWMRLGSGGRREMALNSQQHNALVYANPTTDEEAQRAEKWFALLAGRVNEGLAQCGYPMSEIVARDPRWRKPIRDWKKTYREWILQADEQALAVTPVFFDLRAIYGDQNLVEEVRRDIIDALNVEAMDPQRQFFTLFAGLALEHRPPLSFFKRFVIDRSGEHRNTFDIRDRGVLPIVSAARVLALEIRYIESANTFDRLRRVAEAIPEMSRVVEDATEAYQFLVDFRLEHQLRAFEAGEPPHNRIDPFSLRRLQQNLLRNAFARVTELQEALAKRYGVNRGWLSNR